MVCSRKSLRSLFLATVSIVALSGCEQIAKQQLTEGMLPPVDNPVTELNLSLRALPRPKDKVVVAVYGFTDQTGQFKPNDTVQSLSKAVTQGATSVLVKALQDAGNGAWFTVVERERLDNLMKERHLIQDMRRAYLGEEKLNPGALPPLLFAGILLEGGIIGFDSNIQTGGIGARLLGIGANVQYRLDTVTIYLRAVSTKNGQVYKSVVTHKTIASVGLQGSVFKYIAMDKVLEAEAGITKNEPDQLAIQQAIEKAVYALVMEGSDQGIWAFSDQVQQAALVRDYRAKQFNSVDQAQAQAAKTVNGAASPAATATAEAKPTGWVSAETGTSAFPDGTKN